jgi:TRAP-type transport system periplasmic protein
LNNLKFTKLFGAILLVVVLLSTTVLAACSSTPSTTTITNTTTNATTQTSSVTSTAVTTKTTAVKPITLVFTSHNSGTGFWRNNVIAPYFREIEKRTNGQVLIEEHWNGELVSLNDAYDAMLKGDVDMAEFFPSMLQGRFTMDEVVSFSQYASNRPAWTLYELAKLYPKMNEPYNDGVILLKNCGYSVGMATTKKQIVDLASSKGMKLGPVGKWSAELMSAYGWTPTSVPPEESTTALQTGVQEGSGMSWYLLWEFGWGPIMKYNTAPIRVDEMLVNLSMNKAKWNSLPKDVQTTILGLQEWAINLQDTAVVKNAMESPARAEKEFGIKTYILPQSEIDKMAQLAQPVKAAFIKTLADAGLPSTDYVNKYLELEKKYADSQYAPK